MVSRKGFCYHAVEGKYEGKAPVVEAFIRSMASEGYGVKNDKDRR